MLIKAGKWITVGIININNQLLTVVKTTLFQVHVENINVNEAVVETGYALASTETSRIFCKNIMTKKQDIQPEDVKSPTGLEDISLLFKSEEENEGGQTLPVSKQDDDHLPKMMQSTSLINQTKDTNFSFLNNELSKTISDVLAQVKVRFSLRFAMDPNSVLNQTVKVLSEEKSFNSVCDKIKMLGRAVLDLLPESKELPTVEEKFWKEVPYLNRYQAIIPLQIKLKCLRNECSLEYQDHPTETYDKVFSCFTEWKKAYSEAQVELNSAVEMVAKLFSSFATHLKGIIKGRNMQCFSPSEEYCSLSTALGKEMELAIKGRDFTKCMAAAVDAKIRGRISELKYIFLLMENVSAKCSVRSSNSMEERSVQDVSLFKFVKGFKKEIPQQTFAAIINDIVQDLVCFHQKGKAYKHLHPENILLVDGVAKLCSQEKIVESSLKESWSFKCPQSPGQKEAIDTFADDVYSLGIMILWLSCLGVGNLEAAKKAAINSIPSIKHLIAEEPSERPTMQELLLQQWLLPEALHTNQQLALCPEGVLTMINENELDVKSEAVTHMVIEESNMECTDSKSCVALKPELAKFDENILSQTENVDYKDLVSTVPNCPSLEGINMKSARQNGK
ncbi:uncharacterized protein [Cherax quadricarinatus]